MSMTFEERLNRILPRITSDDFLASKGLGNEIGFWIFEYPPERELDMRAFIEDVVLPGLDKRTPPIRHQTVNLLDLIVNLLKERDLFDKVIDKQRKSGNDAVSGSLKSVLKEDKLAQRLVAQVDLDELDLLMLTGTGAAYPLLRTNTLLSALHPVMRQTPLLLFFPGRYDGFSLSLFDKLADDHYYRAFRLVD